MGLSHMKAVFICYTKKYRCKNWNDIDKAINIIMETDVGTEIELDLKSENIDSIENEQK